MANFPTRANWHTQIRRIESGDSVIGGENAPINLCLGGLAERTDWLKTEVARAVALIGTNQNTASQQFALKTTQINAGVGLTGGGVLRDNTTISMGTPSKITATSQNSAISNTHSHEIDKASTSVAGIVRLSSATDSTAENLAATPKAIKQLADLIGATGSASFPQRGALGSRNLNDLKGTENYGVWHQATSASATTALNYPVTIAGTLFVLPSAYQGVQLYIPFIGQQIHIRHTDSGTFTAWRTIGEVVNNLTSDSTTAALSARQGKLLKEQADKFRVETVNSSDANSYKTDGIYAFVRGGQNLPPNVSACHLVVIGGADGNWCRQIAYKAYSEEIWARRQNDYATDIWSEWQRMDGVNWTGVRDKPNTFAGYGLTGNKTYDGQLTIAGGNYPAIALSPDNSQNKWQWEVSGEASFFIHRNKTSNANVKLIYLPERAGTLALNNETVNLTGNQTVNGIKTFATQLKINGGEAMSYGGWSNRLQFDGAHAAITLSGRYAIGLHGNGNFYLFDNDQRAYGLTYNYAAKSLTVGGEITSGSHHLTRKADRATTLSGYGITDGVTPTQLQAAIAGIVSSSPAALDTLRELAAALGNDPNYATTTARKLGEAAPSGTVAWFAGSSAPAGWLKANGAAISRTTYAALFAAIGTTYGAGDGRTTFNLPDLRGEFVRGWDDGRQVDSARVLGSRQSDALQQHSHELPNDTDLLTASRGGAIGHGGANTRGTHTRPLGNVTGARTAAETRPRNIALLGIIKI